MQAPGVNWFWFRWPQHVIRVVAFQSNITAVIFASLTFKNLGLKNANVRFSTSKDFTKFIINTNLICKGRITLKLLGLSLSFLIFIKGLETILYVKCFFLARRRHVINLPYSPTNRIQKRILYIDILQILYYIQNLTIIYIT